MSIKGLLCAIACVVWSGCSHTYYNAQGTNNINRARSIAAHRFQQFRTVLNETQGQGKDASFDETFQWTMYERTMKSPLASITFLLYSLDNYDPTPHVIVSDLNGVQEEVSNLDYDPHDVANDKVIERINNYIKRGALLSEDVCKLSEFLVNLRDVNGDVQTVDSWKDIGGQSAELVPEEIRKLISAPLVSTNQGNQECYSFIWNAETAELMRLRITYRAQVGIDSYSSEIIGQYGEPIIKL